MDSIAAAVAPFKKCFWIKRSKKAGENNEMKKFLGSVGLIAMAAPAFAADLPARTYTMAPVMV